jgi:hypothetical protein
MSHIAGTQDLKLHQLYRAMDFLEANKEAIEQAIFYRVADLLNLDVEVIFYDTTSLHFEIDEEDRVTRRETFKAVRRQARSPMRPRANAVTARTGATMRPRLWSVWPSPATAFPVRHWVFPGNTVDVTTVAKVKEDLRGWQLSRCLFVGDAGMVSQANLQTLSKGGGKYLSGDADAPRRRDHRGGVVAPGALPHRRRESGGQGSHRGRW